MVDCYDNVKLMDFGLAGNLETQEANRTQLVGTPHYMSPEQIRNENTDLRSDIYSLGATLYHILAGKTLFSGENIMAILHQQIHKQPPSLPPYVPIDLTQMIEKMLAKNPEDRFQNYTMLKKNALGLHVIKQVAPLHKRILATTIDSFLFVMFGFCCKYLVFKDNVLPQNVIQSLLQYFLLGWFWIYSSFRYSRSGQTFGMRVMNIRILNSYGLQMQTGRAILRFFLCYLLAFLFISYSLLYGRSFVYLPLLQDWVSYFQGVDNFIQDGYQKNTAICLAAIILTNILGYCIAVFDRRKRALHDFLAGTIVIENR